MEKNQDFGMLGEVVLKTAYWFCKVNTLVYLKDTDDRELLGCTAPASNRV